MPRLPTDHRAPRPSLAVLGGLAALLLAGCAAVPEPACPGGPGCPPAEAVEDAFVDELHRNRDWDLRDELAREGIDPVRMASEVDLPIEAAKGRLFGTNPDAARESLAAKVWMIENARHTLDLTYYIYRSDLVGQALLAALCDAVIRGVDVRLMVDSAGSLTTNSLSLGWLAICEENAGWMIDAQGRPTNRRARVQIVIFNAMTNFSASPNRRSHDKMLLADARFDEHALLKTGGRNISLDYYAVTEDGENDPKAYMDMELLLRPGETEGEYSIGDISSGYFTLLFNFRGNRKLSNQVRSEQQRQVYYNAQARAYDALEALRAMPLMSGPFAAAARLDDPAGWQPVDALLAHNMANLDNKGVVRNAVDNYANNPNSIISVLGQIADDQRGDEHTRMVSPYLFLARYTDSEGNALLDEAESLRQFIDENPEARFELVTNSVLTSDNFSAQSVIDLDTAPRLLLPPELRERWLALSSENEGASELVNSPEWKAAVNHPRVAIYVTGGLDSSSFPGGDVTYGKLHAKYWQAEDLGFVGTDNFDYRSRLYNSEMGYFFRGGELSAALAEDFEYLKTRSVRWGTPEWFELRRQVMAMKGTKGWTTRSQRSIYKTLRGTGLKWWF